MICKEKAGGHDLSGNLVHPPVDEAAVLPVSGNQMLLERVRNKKYILDTCQLLHDLYCYPFIFQVKSKSTVRKRFFSTCKPPNLGDSEVFCKPLTRSCLFLCASYVTHIPGSIRKITFGGPKKVYTVYTVYTGLPPDVAGDSKIQMLATCCQLTVHMSVHQSNKVCCLKLNR